jgi:anti-sigma factor ChrR (cupin superfamily)
MAMEHIPDADLELYALGRLSESTGPPIDEHLLVCADCRELLTGWDEYVRAMRSACRQLERHSAGGR